MANTTVLGDIDFALKLNEKFVGERITAPDTSPLMALYRQAPDQRAEGRSLKAYFNYTTRLRGTARHVAENGDLPSGGRAATDQANITARLGALEVSYSDHELQAFRGKGSKHTRLTVARDLARNVKLQRERILADWMGRNDGVKGRTGSAEGSSTTLYSSIPIRFCPGDVIAGYADSSGDARGFAGAEAGNGVVYVQSISWDEKDTSSAYEGRINLSAASTFANNSILVVAGSVDESGDAAIEPVLGWEAHFDTVNDGNWDGWDADDDVTYDHVDEYAGLTRSSDYLANVQTVFANSNPLTLTYITRGAQKCISAVGQGNIEGGLCAVMHPLQWDRFLATQEGKVPKDDKVRINGVDFEIPYIAVAGAGRMPVITSYYVKDGTVTIVPKKALYKVWSQVGWDPNGMQRQTGSGTAYAASWVHYWTYWDNSYCDMPYRACLIHGLDTSNV